MNVSLVALLLFPAVAGALVKQPSVADDAELPEVKEVSSLLAGFRHVESEIKSEMAIKDPKKRKLNLKKLHRLSEDVEQVLPDELQKLSSVFKDAQGVPAKREKVHWLRKRAIEKLRKHQGSAARRPLEQDTAECGTKLKASSVGLKKGAVSAKYFGKSFLQENPYDESIVVPGAGSTQVVKSEGNSAMGTVNGLEPMLNVYKDGFWSVGCFMDKMFANYDKYGDNKDRYHKDAKFVNISIAGYDELVLKEKQEKMTPRTCFQFCRTIEGMAFFGITGGSHCYCMPFYIPDTGGEGDDCGMPCPGDGNQNCGGRSKSSIYELHVCGDRGASVDAGASSSGETLSAFYAAAIYAQEIAKHMQASGALLQEVGGLGGDPDTADLGMEAKRFAGELTKSLLNGECVDAYNILLTTYEESESTALLDMKVASNLMKAEDAIMTMQAQSPKVMACAEKASDLILQAYPVYKDGVEAETDAELLAVEEQYGTAIMNFYPLKFVTHNKDDPKPSTCHGKLLGKPMLGTIAQCAQACYDAVHPEKCVAYQFFHLGGGESGHGGDEDTMIPLCFMYKEIKSVTTYDCGFLGGASLLQKANVTAQQALRGKTTEPEEEEDRVTQIEESNCDNVKQAVEYAAMTCEELFGSDSSVMSTCSDACSRSKGALFGSVCMSNFAEIVGATPNTKTEEVKRCFAGARNKEVSNSGGAMINLLPHDEHGVILAGDATLGGTTVFEPIIWSTSD